MKHEKFNDVKTLVNAGIPTLLIGERGSGKTSLAVDVAEALNLKLYSISMTRQTTLGILVGFISVNGTYIPSDLFEAVKNGGMVLLDEINAADPNVLLCLNTLENGYMAFPTKGIVKCHKDFRLVATANPATSEYTGRAKLDAATMDRFDKVHIELDNDLEASLVTKKTHSRIIILRDILKQNNTNMHISMRDCLRYQKRADLKLEENYIPDLLKDNEHIYEQYRDKVEEFEKTLPEQSQRKLKQEDCTTIDELIQVALEESNDNS